MQYPDYFSAVKDFVNENWSDASDLGETSTWMNKINNIEKEVNDAREFMQENQEKETSDIEAVKHAHDDLAKLVRVLEEALNKMDGTESERAAIIVEAHKRVKQWQQHLQNREAETRKNINAANTVKELVETQMNDKVIASTNQIKSLENDLQRRINEQMELSPNGTFDTFETEVNNLQDAKDMILQQLEEEKKALEKTISEKEEEIKTFEADLSKLARILAEDIESMWSIQK